MRKIQLLLVLALLIVQLNTLSIPQDHNVVIDKSTEYLQGLKEQQSKFAASITNLDTKVDQDLAAAGAQGDILKKITTLQEAILNQEDLLSTSSTILFPVLVVRDQCYGISPQERTAITAKSDNIINYLKNLQTNLQKNTNPDVRVRELLLNTKNQIKMLQLLKKSFQQNCNQQAVIAPTILQSNLRTPQNWVTGTKSMTQIVKEYIDRAQANTNVNNCDISTPFIVNGQCDTCPPKNCQKCTPQQLKKNIYDMTLGQCIGCEDGKAFDPEKKQCVEVAPIYGNINSQFLSRVWKTAPPAIPNALQCPVEAPFYSKVTNQCINCPQPEYFLVDTSTCKKPNINNVDAAKRTVSNPLSVPGVNEPQLPCPVQFPFFFKDDCYDCPVQTPIFKQDTGQCQACPPNTKYDALKKQCTGIKYVTNYPELTSNKNTIPPFINLPNPIPQQQGQLCPPNTPFLSKDNNCITCQLPQYFDFTKKICDTCPQGTTYNLATKSCVMQEFQTNFDQIDASQDPKKTPYDPYIGSLSKPASYKKDGENGVCPKDKPFYSTKLKQCVNCDQTTGNYFDFSTSQCVKCTNYDVVRHICVNSNLQLLKDRPTKGTLQPQDPLAKQLCPNDAPYYSKTQKTCISCNDNSYIDVAAGTCVVCPPNTGYEVNLQKCAGTNNAEVLAKKLKYEGTLPTPEPQQKCPANLPFYHPSSKTCIECNPQDGYPIYDLIIDACTACGPGYGWQKNLRTCVGINIQNNPQNLKYIGSTITSPKPEQADYVCPAATPYYNANQQQCVACGPTEAFDYKLNQCVPCQKFDPVARACINSKQNNNPQIQASPSYPYLGQLKPNAQGVQLCPKQAPFYISSKNACVKCPDDPKFPNNLIFDLASEKCVACRNYNPNDHKCYTSNNPFVQKVGYVGELPPQEQNAQVCPQAQPYYSPKASRCIPCNNGYYDLAKDECVQCPSQTAFQVKLKACKATNSPIIKTNNTPYSGNLPQDQQQTKNNCPDNAPFYQVKTRTCIPCVNPTPIFDFGGDGCIACPTGLSYEKNAHTCVRTNAPAILQSPQGKNLYTNKQEADLKALPTQHPCPNEKPFYSSKRQECVTCDDKPLQAYDFATQACIDCSNYNAQTRTCSGCPPFSFFDTTLNPAQCVPFVSNPNPASPSDKYVGQIQPVAQNQRPCPPETPYYNTNTKACQACKDVFFIDTNECKPCPTGQSYDNHQCKGPVTNVQAKNWVADNPVQVIQNIKSQYAKGNVTPCPYNRNNPADPTNLPYFDRTKGKCINCPANTVFVYEKNSCQTCPAGTTFNQISHKCFSNVKQTNFPDTPNIKPNIVLYNNQLPYQQIKNIYYKQGVPTCDSTSPNKYWNGKQCIPCDPAKNEYFSIDFAACVVCPYGKIPEAFQCRTTTYDGQVINPNIASLTDNVFRHQNIKNLQAQNI